MKTIIGGSAITLALLLAGCSDDDTLNNSAATANFVNDAPIAQVEAPNGDWTQVVSETADYGYVMGNPNAPVKLVEYASITCPHCADFTAAASESLKNEYVKSGQVSWEYRPALLFPTDLGIFQLLRCQGPAPFFRAAEQLYADQKNWVGKFQAMTPEQAAQLEATPPAKRVLPFMRAGGIDQFFSQRGMPQSKVQSCLADEAGLQKLVEVTSAAGARDQVVQTPTFFINGEKLDAGTWPQLEKKLREAIG